MKKKPRFWRCRTRKGRDGRAGHTKIVREHDASFVINADRRADAWSNGSMSSTQSGEGEMRRAMIEGEVVFIDARKPGFMVDRTRKEFPMPTSRGSPRPTTPGCWARATPTCRAFANRQAPRKSGPTAVRQHLTGRDFRNATASPNRYLTEICASQGRAIKRRRLTLWRLRCCVVPA